MVTDRSRADELEWVQLRKDMDNVLQDEMILQKGFRKFKENPTIPIGCMATVAALSTGIYSFLKGRTQMSQYMMRARVIAQGFTIVAVLMSLGATIPKQK